MICAKSRSPLWYWDFISISFQKDGHIDKNMALHSEQIWPRYHGNSYVLWTRKGEDRYENISRTMSSGRRHADACVIIIDCTGGSDITACKVQNLEFVVRKDRTYTSRPSAFRSVGANAVWYEVSVNFVGPAVGTDAESKSGARASPYHFLSTYNTLFHLPNGSRRGFLETLTTLTRHDDDAIQLV